MIQVIWLLEIAAFTMSFSSESVNPATRPRAATAAWVWENLRLAMKSRMARVFSRSGAKWMSGYLACRNAERLL
jgi:hypothetical protein